jgi:hypothetical protein
MAVATTVILQDITRLHEKNILQNAGAYQKESTSAFYHHNLCLFGSSIRPINTRPYLWATKQRINATTTGYSCFNKHFHSPQSKTHKRIVKHSNKIVCMEPKIHKEEAASFAASMLPLYSAVLPAALGRAATVNLLYDQFIGNTRGMTQLVSYQKGVSRGY